MNDNMSIIVGLFWRTFYGVLEDTESIGIITAGDISTLLPTVKYMHCTPGLMTSKLNFNNIIISVINNTCSKAFGL